MFQTARHAVLEAYTLIASKNRANVEQAIQHLGAILSDNPNDVRALLALSTALMVLKQTPKVRTGPRISVTRPDRFVIAERHF